MPGAEESVARASSPLRLVDSPPAVAALAVGALLFLALATAPPARAAEIVAGVSMSTLGPGVDLSMPLGPRFGVRLGAHRGTVGRDFTEDGIDYVGDLKLESASLLLDWHPTGGGFRLSGGVLVNRNEVVARASGDDALLEIGDVEVPASAVASLRGTVRFDRLAPYLGIGASTPLGRDRRWWLLLDLGVAYQGAPEVDLEAALIPELAPLEPAFQEQVRIEERNLERAIDEYDLYPVVAVGLGYRF